MDIHALTPISAGVRSVRVDAREVPPPGLQESATATPPTSGTDNPRAVSESTATETPDNTRDDAPTATTDVSGKPLEADAQRLVEQLKQRDTEVRAHEQAHMAAGGGYITSGPSYSYQTGPDGRRYAIGGEVGIDTAMDPSNPDGNLVKARAIIRAALAPAEPSSQDMRVAASAREMELRAQQDIRARQVKLYQDVMEDGIKAMGFNAASSDTSDTDTSSTSPVISGGQARLAVPFGQLDRVAGVNHWA